MQTPGPTPDLLREFAFPRANVLGHGKRSVSQVLRVWPLDQQEQPRSGACQNATWGPTQSHLPWLPGAGAQPSAFKEPSRRLRHAPVREPLVSIIRLGI